MSLSMDHKAKSIRFFVLFSFHCHVSMHAVKRNLYNHTGSGGDLTQLLFILFYFIFFAIYVLTAVFCEIDSHSTSYM